MKTLAIFTANKDRIPSVKFCDVSPVQLPNNSGAGPGTERGAAREIFVV